MTGIYLSYGNLKLDIENPNYDDKILSELGEKQALDMCNLLLKKYGVPSLIISSPYERTRIMSIILKNRIKIKYKKEIYILVDNNLSKYWPQKIQGKNIDLSEFTQNYNPILKESRSEFIDRVKTHLKKFGLNKYLQVVKQILNNMQTDNDDDDDDDDNNIEDFKQNAIKIYLKNQLKQNTNENKIIWYVTHPIFIRQVADELKIISTLDVNTWIYPTIKKYSWINDKSMLLVKNNNRKNYNQMIKKNQVPIYDNNNNNNDNNNNNFNIFKFLGFKNYYY